MARYGEAGAAVSTRYRFLGSILLSVAAIRIECLHFGANMYVSPVDSWTQTWVYASGMCAQFWKRVRWNLLGRRLIQGGLASSRVRGLGLRR